MSLTLDSLFSGVVGPLLVALVLALSAYVVPSVRWSRTLKREADIFNGLPPGDEREYWRDRVEAQAARLRFHEQQVPMWERVVGWLIVAYLCLFLYVALSGNLKPPSNLWAWIGTWTAYPFALYIAVRTLVGLPYFSAATPELKAARRRVRQLRKAP